MFTHLYRRRPASSWWDHEIINVEVPIIPEEEGDAQLKCHSVGFAVARCAVIGATHLLESL
jgi:hypothetical protein